MFRRFLPRETSFFDYFERHGALITKGAEEVLALVTEGTNFATRAEQIKEIEHQADVITHECLRALHKTFITPIGREEIHRLIARMDDVLDFIDSAANRIALYELTEMTPEIKSLAEVLLKSVRCLEGALPLLRKMKDAEGLLDKCIEINRLENDGDVILRSAVARLFREEKDPIVIIKWKEVYEHLESATDRCEDVANIIEGVVVEHA